MICNHDPRAMKYKYYMVDSQKRIGDCSETESFFLPTGWHPHFYVTQYCPGCGLESERQGVNMDMIDLNLKKALARHSLEIKLKLIEQAENGEV